MSREIKFRGMRKDNGAWVYGYLIGKGVIVGEIVDWDSEYFNCEFWRKVDPETVGQYTGLRDKNGKDIYEGDVVKSVALLNDHFQNGAINILVVRNWMGNSCLCFDGQETGTPIYPLIVTHEIEIIGNIYKHPHLLAARSAIGTTE